MMVQFRFGLEEYLKRYNRCLSKGTDGLETLQLEKKKNGSILVFKLSPVFFFFFNPKLGMVWALLGETCLIYCLRNILCTKKYQCCIFSNVKIPLKLSVSQIYIFNYLNKYLFREYPVQHKLV